MSVRDVDIKVGDKLRYLGGDPANEGEVMRGRVYDVVDIDYDVIVIDTINNGSWAIGDEYKNVDCFEKVEEEEVNIAEYKNVKIGDSAVFYEDDPDFSIIKGKEYKITDVKDSEITLIDGEGYWQTFSYPSKEYAIASKSKDYKIYENNGGNFSYEDLKIGDKLRFVKIGEYVGIEDLIGEVLIIEGKNEEGIFYAKGFGCFPTWNIHKEEAHLYELLEDEEPSDNKPSSIELIANLAQEVTELKRELTDLRDAMQAQAYEDSERIERILDDIVMLDERTQDESAIEPNPVRKVVYEYERYYD